MPPTFAVRLRIIRPRTVLSGAFQVILQREIPSGPTGGVFHCQKLPATLRAPPIGYPSDLSDDEWKLIEPLIPPGKRGGDKRTVIMREVVNGLMYILSTGCQWRAIPKDLPPRSTLYDYFDLWSWDRTLDLIHHELYVKCREAIGREASPTAAVIDSQSVKSAEKDAMGQAARQL